MDETDTQATDVQDILLGTPVDLQKTPNPRQESFTTSLRRRTQNIAAVVTTIFLLLLIVGTGLGIIDGETLSALKPLVEELVENQASFYNLTDSGF